MALPQVKAAETSFNILSETHICLSSRGEKVFGEMVLAEITPKLLAGYKTQRRIENAAPATINKELQLVRHAFNVAIREWDECDVEWICTRYNVCSVTRPA